MSTTLRITEEMTVRELVRVHPAMRKALEELGIDYCCGGAKTLKQAAAEQGVDFAALEQAIDEAFHSSAAEASPQKDWMSASAGEIADHIEQKHHSYLKEQLPRLAGMLPRLKAAHPRHRATLEKLDQTMQALRAELEQHLQKEEIVLFPLIRHMDAAAGGGEVPQAHCGTVANPIAQMEREHEHAGDVLEQVKQITDDYTLPEDACETFAAYYQGLRDMENDLHEHIHLENNILFPKAIDLEKKSKSK